MKIKNSLMIIFLNCIVGSCFSVEMIKIPSSEFKKIINNNYEQTVQISEFYVSKNLITIKEWNEYLTDSNKYSKDYVEYWNKEIIEVLYEEKGKDVKPNPQWPAFYISFEEVIEYCNWKSKKEKLLPYYYLKSENNVVNVFSNPKSNGYRLITKAEWELLTNYYSDKRDIDNALQFGCFFENNNGLSPVEVSHFKANQYGLYDLFGTMKEFLWDFFGNEEYVHVVKNPQGPKTFIPDEDQLYFNEPLCERRVIVNGAFNQSVEFCIENPFSSAVSTEKQFIGFRLAKNSLKE